MHRYLAHVGAYPVCPHVYATRAVERNHELDKRAIGEMAKQTAAKSVSAKQVAIDELRAADGPLKAKEIAKRVIDSGRFSGLKGKTPEATISAMLAVGSKPDGPFKRVDKGTYTLADAHAMNGGPTQKRQAKPRTQKGVAKPRPQKQHPTKRTG